MQFTSRKYFLSSNHFIINFAPLMIFNSTSIDSLDTRRGAKNHYQVFILQNVILIVNLRVKNLLHCESYFIQNIIEFCRPSFHHRRKNFSPLSRIITSSNINPNEIVNRFFSYYECMITFHCYVAGSPLHTSNKLMFIINLMRLSLF